MGMHIVLRFTAAIALSLAVSSQADACHRRRCCRATPCPSRHCRPAAPVVEAEFVVFIRRADGYVVFDRVTRTQIEAVRRVDELRRLSPLQAAFCVAYKYRPQQATVSWVPANYCR